MVENFILFFTLSVFVFLVISVYKVTRKILEILEHLKVINDNLNIIYEAIRLLRYRTLSTGLWSNIQLRNELLKKEDYEVVSKIDKIIKSEYSELRNFSFSDDEN